MLSYKNWKTLNESMETLGVSAPASLGIMGSNVAREEEQLLAEMKKKMAKCKSKMRKKMNLGDEVDTGDEEEGDGDGEMVKPAAKKDADPDADVDAAADSQDGDDDMGDDDSDDVAEKKPVLGKSDDEGDEDTEGSTKEMMWMKKKMNKGGKKDDKKKDKKESVESDPWMNSLVDMMGVPHGSSNWDGFRPIQTEAGPGEVGHAPQGRIGSL